MNTRSLLSFVLGLPFAAGCSGSADDYADRPDVAATERAFRCGGGEEDEGPACEVLDEFQGAGAVTWPGETADVYVGAILCSGSANHAFSVFTVGAPSSGASAPARRPAGNIARCIRSFHERYRPATEATLTALRRGDATPGLGAEDVVPADWSGWRTPCTPSPSASKSDGPSVLLGGPGSTPAWWDDASPRPPTEYLRQTGRVLYYLRPPGGPGGEACVTRAYRLPTP